MILIISIHECDAINFECIYGKKLPKMGTREQKRKLPLLTNLVFMDTFPTENNYKYQLNFK